MKDLNIRLDSLGWSVRTERYQSLIDRVRDIRPAEVIPSISVVVISNRFTADTETCLKVLEVQRNTGFETIFVNNGQPGETFTPLERYTDVLISLNRDTGAYMARNIGAVFARAPILLFLDDDALPADDLIAAHLRCFRRYDVVSVRGVCLPRTNTQFNGHPRHYYLGNLPYPVFANIEGNTSYAATSFFRAGGWDDDIVFGGGGLTLALRLLKVEPDHRKQMYSPLPVIRHDYSREEGHVVRKFDKQTRSRIVIFHKFPDHLNDLGIWETLRGRADLLPVRDNTVPERERPTRADINQSLYRLLDRYGWSFRFGWYHFLIAGINQFQSPDNAPISVIFVADSLTDALKVNSRTLRDTCPGLRIVVVNNGVNPGIFGNAAEWCHTMVHLRMKANVNTARNIGAIVAQTPVYLFLDPDHTPIPGLARKHLEGHRLWSPVSLEGIVVKNGEPTPVREPRCIFPVEADHISFAHTPFIQATGWPEMVMDNSPMHELLVAVLNTTMDYGLHRFDPGLVCFAEHHVSPDHRTYPELPLPVWERVPALRSLYRHWLSNAPDLTPRETIECRKHADNVLQEYREMTQANHYRQAVALLTEETNRQPLNWRLKWLLSMTHRMTGNPGAALPYADVCIQALPLNVGVMREYLEVLFAMGRFQEADNACENFLKNKVHVSLQEMKARIERVSACLPGRPITQMHPQPELPIHRDSQEEKSPGPTDKLALVARANRILRQVGRDPGIDPIRAIQLALDLMREALNIDPNDEWLGRQIADLDRKV